MALFTLIGVQFKDIIQYPDIQIEADKATLNEAKCAHSPCYFVYLDNKPGKNAKNYNKKPKARIQHEK